LYACIALGACIPLDALVFYPAFRYSISKHPSYQAIKALKHTSFYEEETMQDKQIQKEITSVTFRLPNQLLKRLQEAKWIQRQSLSKVVITALREYCDRNQIPEQEILEPKLPQESRLLESMWQS
jgi:hypothetical protein